MTVWVTYYYDVHEEVEGIYATEIAARRAADKRDGFIQVVEVSLPCDDFSMLFTKPEVIARDR